MFNQTYYIPEKDEQVTHRAKAVNQLINELDMSPELKDRFKSFKVTWVEVDGHVVPNISVEWHEK